MRNPFSAVKRYVYWRVDCLFTAPYFPVWCGTGAAAASGGDSARHTLRADGAVVWNAEEDSRLPYADHVETSGFYAACITSYGATRDGMLRLHRHAVFPMLRVRPNDTRGSLSHNFLAPSQATLRVDGKRVRRERMLSAALEGFLTLESEAQSIHIERKLFAAVRYPAVVERMTLVNASEAERSVEVLPPGYLRRTPARRGVTGAYELFAGIAGADGRFSSAVQKPLCFSLKAGERAVFYQVYGAARAGETLAFSAADEEQARAAFLGQMRGSLRLETPERELDAAFALAKIRACESIFRTKNGLMHCPGGGSFYAALWTNDQCEYASPVFPFIGYPAGLEEAENCFRLFCERMDPALEKPLVSSIIAEGDGVWNGAGDRGDGAMFAYGAARYALACGDAAAAERLWDGIVWGIEYSLRKKNADGVIRSDSDELENRFPSGGANLFTSCLLYDALLNAAYLADSLKKGEGVSVRYRGEANALREAIERYFGARVQGFDTYRYYAGNDVLRAWICVPLTVGIFDRARGTLDALYSDRLWTEDGLRTQAGRDTFWDRATLFALRGAFAAGDRERAYERLARYTRRRLLGEHVPYAVEAWPEGNQKHLAAESALYLRAYTEGLFGIRPTGLCAFELCPQLPRAWDRMALRDICAFGARFDVEVSRVGEHLRVLVKAGEEILLETAVENGGRISVSLEQTI